MAKVLNPATKRQVKVDGHIGRALLAEQCTDSISIACDPGMIKNPFSNRCVSVNGAVGRALLAQQSMGSRKSKKRLMNTKTEDDVVYHVDKKHEKTPNKKNDEKMEEKKSSRTVTFNETVIISSYEVDSIMISYLRDRERVDHITKRPKYDVVSCQRLKIGRLTAGF
jgi:hypothetical protein